MNNDNKPRSVQVALIDYHQCYREMFCKFLRSEGIEVTILEASAEKFLEKLNMSNVKPDICIVEIQNGRKTNYQLPAQIKLKWPKIKILVFTESNKEASLKAMAEIGVNGYLCKDCSMDAIIELIHKIHNSDNCFFSQKLKTTTTPTDYILESLTATEILFLGYTTLDMSYSMIATNMKFTEKAIEGHRSKLFTKIGAKGRVGLVRFAYKHGFYIEDDELETYINS